MQASVLITGATGFIGRHLLRRLTATGPVRVLLRIPDPRICASGVDVCIGNLLDPQSLKTACRDVSVVYHLAAVVPGKATRPVLWETNVRGTSNLVDACLENGVRRLVFLSSVAAYAPPFGGCVDERHALGGADTYGQSKAAAESCLGKVGATGLEYVILRPCQVYGPGDQSGYSARLQSLLARRHVPVAGLVPRPFSLVYVDDLVTAVIAAGSQPSLRREAINVAGPDRISLTDLAREQGARLLTIPAQAVQKAFELRWLLKNAGPRGMRPRCKPYARDRVHGSLFLGGPVYAIDRAASRLGFRPEIGARDGIRRLIECSK